MRVMSYNIHSGKSMDNVFDMPSILKVIRGQAPDICALNEVRMRTTDVGGMELARYLGEGLSMNWRFGRAIDIAGGEYGNAILSRYPILSSRVVPVPELPPEERVGYYEPRAALECVLETENGPVRAITCHFGLSVREREEAVKTVLGMIGKDMPCMLMGDFNAEPNDPVLAPIREALCDTAGDAPLTFSARSPKIKIDYIFTSKEFACGPLRAPKTLASDHLPIVADMTLDGGKRLYLGVKETNITPEGPMQMIGYGASDRSKGVLKPLFAQATVWRQAGRRSCLVAIDHIGFSTVHASCLRKAIGEAIGCGKESVMLCFSHTHSAPNDSIETEYAAELDKRVLAAVREAMNDMIPVRVGWKNASANIGVNRRAGADDIDGRVGVCEAINVSSGKPVLLLLRVPVHNNCLKGDNPYISPDFFGETRERLKAEYGCAVAITQGASGNIAPRFFQSKRNPPDANDPMRFTRSETACEDMAQELCAAVNKAVPEIVAKENGRLLAYTAPLRLASHVPSYERALEVGEEARREVGANPEKWLAEVKRLHDSGVCVQYDDLEMQYFAIGEGCLCGVPNELMCEFALRASAALKDPYFYLGGYTNGCTGYFPTEEEYDKGGYEVYWSMLDYFPYYGRVFPLDRVSATQLIDAAVASVPKA